MLLLPCMAKTFAARKWNGAIGIGNDAASGLYLPPQVGCQKRRADELLIHVVEGIRGALSLHLIPFLRQIASERR